MLIAVVPEPDQDLDATLAEVAGRAASRGIAVAGAVRIDPRSEGAHRCEMVWRDVVTGRTLSLALARGAAATGCRLDQSVVEEAAGLAIAALDAGATLLVLPRFGKQEAAGQGFRAVVARALVDGVPTVIGVSPGHLDAWRDFAAGLAEEMPADPDVILARVLDAVEATAVSAAA